MSIIREYPFQDRNAVLSKRVLCCDALEKVQGKIDVFFILQAVSIGIQGTSGLKSESNGSAEDIVSDVPVDINLAAASQLQR
jgi:hypothetical protein